MADNTYMHPSQPTQHLSGSSSSPIKAELPAAAQKLVDIAKVAMPLTPVASSNVNIQGARQTTVLQSPQKQVVQVTPAVSTSAVEQLLLMKLPVSTPVQLNQQTSVDLTTLLSQAAANKVLPTLIKLSPEAFNQPLSKAQIHSLVTVLAQSHRTPLTLPVEIVSLNNNTLHLQLSTPDSTGKQLLEIPLSQAAKTTINASGTGAKPDIAAALANLKLPAQATLTLTPPASTSTRTEWQATLKLQGPGTTTSGAPSVSGNTIYKSVLPADSPTLKSALKVSLNQGISPQIKPLAQWAESHISAKASQQLQSFSQITPVTTALKNATLTITGSRAQIIAVDAAPAKSLLNALPSVNQQTVKQLNSQATANQKLPVTELSFNQPQSSKASAQTPSAGSASDSLRNQDASVPKSTGTIPAQTAHLKAQQAGATIAQLKLAELSPEVKVAISDFIRTANRLNVVNTHSQSLNTATLIDALQKISALTGTATEAGSSTAQAKASANSSPDASLKALNSVITQLQLDTQGKSQSVLTERELSATNPSGEPLPNAKPPVADSQQVGAAIKQLVTASAWMQSPANLFNPPTGQSFLTGLLQVLQVSLLGRHVRQHTDLEQLLTRAKSAGGAGVTGLLSSLSGRQIREFAQLDSQQNLLKQIKGLLAGHQSAKLANLDQAMQGQDSFYYVLPALQHNQQPSELLIRREHNPKEHKPQEGENTSWNLTMKLSIGDQGELLSKVKIKSQQLYLDIYTSNQSLLEKVGLTLPFLLKRFAQLGLDVQEHKVQLGKIPDTLASKPFQLLETRA